MLAALAAAAFLAQGTAAFERKDFQGTSAEDVLNACRKVASELGFRIADDGSGRLRGEWEVTLERVHKVQHVGPSGMMNPKEEVIDTSKGVFILEVTVKAGSGGKVSVEAKLKEPPPRFKSNATAPEIDEEFDRPREGEGPTKETLAAFLEGVGRVLAGQPSGVAARATSNDRPTSVGPGRQAGGRRVAVLSVYGAENVSAGVLKKLSHREELDRAEGEVVRTLAAAGWDVVPTAESKRLVEAEYDSTYFSLLPSTVSEKFLRERQGEAKKIGKPLDEYMKQRATAAFQYGAASANTAVLVDYALPGNGAVTTIGLANPASKEVTKYTETFLKTMGALAQKLGADAVVLVRLMPDLQKGGDIEGDIAWAGGKKSPGSGYYSTEAVTVQMFDRDGVQIMGARRTGISPEKIDSGMFSLKFSNEKVLDGLRGATDAALSVLLSGAGEKRGGR
jgi:hypothetical protein